MQEHEFEHLVGCIISDHPEYIGAAIRGIMSGQQSALNAAQAAASEARQGMTLALILANKRGKLPDNLMDMIAAQVTLAIKSPACPAEVEFVKSHQDQS